ncbi:50S ribosomal protein L9 [candidate division WOR-3 bacterium]|nr:50S ribosomal protein L9 [candidate division WOR-3 bacterium]
MKIILLEYHPHLGERGKVVTVSDGYARNFLIPQKLAVEDTPSKRRAFEAEEQFHVKKVKKEKESAVSIRDEVNGIQITIEAKTGEEEKLYGSITKKDIADAIEKKGYQIDKRGIKLDEPIRKLGTYDIELFLFQDVSANITLSVVEESDG